MIHLIIRNVGPIHFVDIMLNRINIFIGPQSSGKSTIAKIISTCSWVEKEVCTTMNEKVFADADSFISLISDFHKMYDYFSKASEIFFETDSVCISLKGEKDFHIKLKNMNSYFREKICYIPSERNFVSLPELQGFEFGQTNLRSFLFDWFDAREIFMKDNKTDILKLGIKYFYNPNETKYKDRIEQNNGIINEIPLGSASSGLQSVVPLQIMLQYYSDKYFESYEEKKSFDTESKTRVIRNKLSDIIVLKQLFHDKYEPAQRHIYIRKVNELLHNNDSKVKELLTEYIAAYERLTTPIRSTFIIEEPEQNLFPRTQMDLLYFMLAHLNMGRNHHLVMTTHSPYILYALNNCLLAYLVKDEVEEEIAQNIESLLYALNPNDVSVWSVNDGCLKNEKDELNMTIQDERGLIRKNYFNDVMSNVMGDFTTLLTFME